MRAKDSEGQGNRTGQRAHLQRHSRRPRNLYARKEEVAKVERVVKGEELVDVCMGLRLVAQEARD